MILKSLHISNDSIYKSKGTLLFIYYSNSTPPNNNMNFLIDFLTQDLKKSAPPDSEILDAVIRSLNSKMPDDYLQFIQGHNGADGFVGANSYLQILKIEKLIDWNKNYEVDKYAPGYLIFASDGGGTAYAFHKMTGTALSFKFIGMSIQDKPNILGENFIEFLTYLFRA